MSSDDEAHRMEVSDTDGENTDTTANSVHSDAEVEDRQLPVAQEAAGASAAAAPEEEEERDGNGDNDEAEELPEPRFEEQSDINHDHDYADATHSPKAEPSTAPYNPDATSEDDGQICTICFEPWTSSSEHRLVSLRCGHLFGRSCISKWLKGQGSRCPQCNARARKSEIRAIYARTLKVLDTSERDRALHQLEKETDLRRQSEMECAKLRLKLTLCMQENEQLKKQLMETQMLLNESRSSIKSTEKAAACSDACKPAFTLVKNIEIRGGGCRVMDCSDLLGMLVVSQPSTNPLFPGHGLKKVSLPDMRLQEFLCLHQKPIKDISFHSHDGMVLTASLDRTVKLTSCLSNAVVQTYNLNWDVWSCSWDLDDPCYFFAGVQNGSVYVFDVRVTDKHVHELEALGQKSPVVSLQYMKRELGARNGKCGPLVGHLASCGFYEKLSPTSYSFYPLPLEGRVMSLSCDSSTSHLLASFRPSQKYPKVTHTLCQMCFDNNVASCNLIYAMTGGSAQAQLVRSKLIPHPDNCSSVLVCSGDEEAKAALIWDGSTGALVDSLKAESLVLDLTSFHDQHKLLLSTLTDKNLRVYSWTSN